MKLLKLALLNALRHKGHSLILFAIFCLCTFILAWTFGFLNFSDTHLRHKLYASYGDLAYQTSFFSNAKAQVLFAKTPGIKKVLLEREIHALSDSSKKSVVITLSELTTENKERLLPLLKPLEGKLPQEKDEICTTNYMEGLHYQVGDVIYVTTTTTKNIINTTRYRVTCTLQRNAYKAMGIAYLISSESMSELLDSSEESNLLYFYYDHSIVSQEELEKNVRKMMISIVKKMSYTEKLEQLKIDFAVFKSLKLIVLIFLLPPLAAIIGILLLMNIFKRRREIWTYSSLGMKERTIYLLVCYEHLLLAFFGLGVGLFLWKLSASYALMKNIWISFSYAYSAPIDTQLDLWSIIFLFLIFSFLVFIVVKRPLQKLLNDIPFSY